MSRLLTPRSLASVAAVALVAALVVAACGGGDGDPRLPAFQRGNNLSVVVFGVEDRDAVYYVEDGVTYVVRPSRPDHTLAVVDARVRNDRSTTLLMQVDEESYTLLDKEGNEYRSVNPFEQRELAPNKPQSAPLEQFLWRDFEMQQGFGIRAKALFEVPRDAVPAQFRWDEVDTVFVRFFGP